MSGPTPGWPAAPESVHCAKCERVRYPLEPRPDGSVLCRLCLAQELQAAAPIRACGRCGREGAESYETKSGRRCGNCMRLDSHLRLN